MDILSTVAVAIGSSWVSGINLYAAVGTLGLMGRFAGISLPGGLDVLTNWWVIGTAAVLYLVEFVADKIPYVDSAWDAVHTFIRVPAGAVLAFAAFAKFDGTIQAIALLLGGGLALSSHGTKAATRVALNTSPEPFTNMSASLAEDALAVGSISLAVFYPAVLILLVVTAVVVSGIIIPRIIRRTQGVVKHIRSLRDHFTSPEPK